MQFTIDSRGLTRAGAFNPTTKVAYFLGALS